MITRCAFGIFWDNREGYHARHTSKDVHLEAEQLGLIVETWRPGDSYGARYLFCKRTEHGGMSQLSQTCRGSREALVWLDGYAKGCR